MHRNSHAFRPAADQLESRALLSSMRGPAQFAPLFAVQPRGENVLAGRYVAVETPHLFDDGVGARLDGGGLVRGLGRARMSGTFVLGEYTPTRENIAGRLTLSTPRGTMTVQLTGSTFDGDGDPLRSLFGSSFDLAAAVVSGAGAYKDVSRVGTATVAFDLGTTEKDVPVSPSDFLRYYTTVIDVTQGAMTIKLDLPPTPFKFVHRPS